MQVGNHHQDLLRDRRICQEWGRVAALGREAESRKDSSEAPEDAKFLETEAECWEPGAGGEEWSITV